MRLEVLQALVDAVVAAEGFELVLCELRGEGQGRVLRVYLDKPGGISLADCETVSRRLSARLDADQAAEALGGYVLEVSSPGLERPLVKPADFTRFLGSRAMVQTRLPVAGRRRFTGVLEGFDGQRLTVAWEAAGRAVIEWDNIDKARLAPLWPVAAQPAAKPPRRKPAQR